MVKLNIVKSFMGLRDRLHVELDTLAKEYEKLAESKQSTRAGRTSKFSSKSLKTPQSRQSSRKTVTSGV
jgi:hypothetical protein